MSLTYSQIERRAWELLHATNVTITLRKEKLSDGTIGWITVRYGERRIRIYARRTVDIIRTLVHEAIHDALRVELAPWGRLEEDIVLMTDRNVWNKVIRPNRYLLDRWTLYVAELRAVRG